MDDLVAILSAHAERSIPWSRLRPLFVPGRTRNAIAAFVEEHQHGTHKRTQVTLRLLLAAGLDYQLSLVQQDPQVERVPAPLTAEESVVLINQRLAAEGDLGRIGVDDARRALAFASEPLVDAVSIDGTAVYI